MALIQHFTPGTFLGMSLLVSTLAIACSPTPESKIESASPTVASKTTTAAKFNDRQVVIDFTDKVVIPTYQKFTAKTKDLKTAVDTLAKTPNEQTLKTAQAAWIEAREPWEQGESFTIGPAKSLGLDGSLDTWPLDKNDLEKILKSSDKLTPESVKKLQESQKGYHAIEFLLFGADGKKTIANFTPRDFEYVQAVATVLDEDANKLLAAWTKGVDGKPAYREVIATAGESGNNTYTSVQAAAQEMVEGILDSSTEVAENKLGEPFKKKDKTAIESQYAIANPINDFRNNILCIKNVYFGGIENHTPGKAGLSAYVAKVNPTLDARITQEIEAAIAAVNKIPEPFHTAISDPNAANKIETAIAAVTTVKETFEKDIKPLVIQ